MNNLVCIIHSEDEVSNEVIKPLTPYLFQKINDSKIKILKHCNSKHKKAAENLPKDLDSNEHGYHYKCYKHFTAYNYKKQFGNCEKSEFDSNSGQQTQQESKVNNDSQQPLKEIQINTKICKFCNKGVIKVLGVKQKLIENGQESYHSACRRRSLKLEENKPEIVKKESTSDWHKKRNIHNQAFNELVDYLKDEILEKEKLAKLSNLYNIYMDFLISRGFNDANESGFLVHHLKEKIIKYFGSQITIDKIEGGYVLYKTGMNMSASVKARLVLEEEEDNPIMVLKKAAYILRKSILSMPEKTVDCDLNLNSPLNEDNEIPDSVKGFVSALFHGPSFTNSETKCTPRMKALQSDMVFSVSNAKIVPKKQIALGLGLKSMVGSKQMLRILNKFGHTVNYWMAEAIETTIAENMEDSKVTPEGIIRDSAIPTFLAFDNYDENSETLSGKGTFHETVGICFQNKLSAHRSDPTCQNAENYEVEPVSLRKITKKRKLEFRNLEIEPYCKRPKLTGATFSGNKSDAPESFLDAKIRDDLWVFSHSLFNTDIPMWTGFNSKTVQDNRQEQTVSYIRNYDESSTNPAMVHETLKITKKIASECEQSYGVVTYDLAIAKPAIQIQSLESPKFDNLFIQFGAFHLFMAFFSAVGKIVSESGFSHILCESGVLAENSVNGIISGKHFNRCKRLHTLFALALKLQHVKYFISCSSIDFPESFGDFLMEFYENPKGFETKKIPAELKKFVDAYETFCEATRKGEQGATAKFWMIYIDLIFLYLKMSRAVRMNDIDLFTYCLPMMTNIFFVTNHHNYARWMVLYHENLINLDKNFPGLKETLQEGGLSVKRSNIAFSAAPVDQTLEHTVNCDAASRLTGIVSLTNQPSALMRWTLTRSVRSEIVTHLKKMAELDVKEDVSIELRKSRIARDKKDLQAISEVIENSTNPFCDTLNTNTLNNIGGGANASEITQKYLLHVMEKGEELRISFVKECKVDPKRFEEKISKQVISNFESEGLKVKLKCKENKIKELGLTCGVFGRLLTIGIEHKIDMKKLLEYSLTPLPLSLTHIDGTMLKTDKSVLLKYLEKQVKTNDLPERNVDLIDGMFYLHNLPKKLPETYGSLSSLILGNICLSKATRVDMIFDCYEAPTIKDCEREKRGGSLQKKKYVIQGPQQKRPKDFNKELTNCAFKEAFTEFLAKDWLDKRHKKLLFGKTIFFTFKEKCFHISENTREEVPQLSCNHKEADTRIAFHLDHVLKSEEHSQESPIHVIVRTGDTDVLIILLSALNRIPGDNVSGLQVFLDFGSGIHRRSINVSEISKLNGPEFCKALPGFHAFTGCDYTSAFSRKGKKKPLNILKKNDLYMSAFGKLGETNEESSEVKQTLEKFTCDIYGYGNTININEVRYQIFLKKNKPTQTNPFEKIKTTDPSVFPPCQKVLLNKIKRCNFVCKLWNNTSDPNPLGEMRPENHGWELNEGNNMYIPKWNPVHHLPTSLLEVEDTAYDQVSPDNEDDRFLEKPVEDDEDDDENDDDRFE